MELRPGDERYQDWKGVRVNANRMTPRCIDCDVPLQIDFTLTGQYLGTCEVCGLRYNVVQRINNVINVNIEGVPDPCITCKLRCLPSISDGFSRGDCGNERNRCGFHGLRCSEAIGRCSTEWRLSKPGVGRDEMWPYRGDFPCL